jgi:hypothetical protein
LLQILMAGVIAIAPRGQGQEAHNHGDGGQLGETQFAVSCQPQAQPPFDRAVALLHSFDYAVAERAFKDAANADPRCAMAWWGAAITHFHPLWPTPLPVDERAVARQQIAHAQQLITPGEGQNRDELSGRERQFIAAAGIIFQDDATPYQMRLDRYEQAMATIAVNNPKEVEVQMFYALALLANASPFDKTHAKQKKAADILEPLYARYPHHPGAAHYLIHAYDNAELAKRGLPMARLYSTIAPAVPHALHMPSHTYTRLGMWDDSISSNKAARAAAHRVGDAGEELHAMDYLVYAYLQAGRDEEAARVVADLKAISQLNTAEFKIAYAATAMPIRSFVERGDWKNAAAVIQPATVLPEVKAIAVWAQGLGLTRGEEHDAAEKQIADLQTFEDQLAAAGNSYWASQTKILKLEVTAWAAQAQNKPVKAAELLRAAANEEDGMEKLPVTPGPIVPAREQLGQLLLLHQQWDAAEREFKVSLVNAPGRRGALDGVAEARKHQQAD